MGFLSLCCRFIRWVIFPSFFLLSGGWEWGILLIVFIHHLAFNCVEKIVLEMILSLTTSGIFTIFISRILFSLDITQYDYCKWIKLDKSNKSKLLRLWVLCIIRRTAGSHKASNVFLEWSEVRLSILSLFSSKYLRISVWEAEENFWYSCL